MEFSVYENAIRILSRVSERILISIITAGLL